MSDRLQRKSELTRSRPVRREGIEGLNEDRCLWKKRRGLCGEEKRKREIVRPSETKEKAEKEHEDSLMYA